MKVAKGEIYFCRDGQVRGPVARRLTVPEGATKPWRVDDAYNVGDDGRVGEQPSDLDLIALAEQEVIELVLGGIYQDFRGETVGPIVESTSANSFYKFMDPKRNWHLSVTGRSYPDRKSKADIRKVISEPIGIAEMTPAYLGEWEDAEQ